MAAMSTIGSGLHLQEQHSQRWHMARALRPLGVAVNFQPTSAWSWSCQASISFLVSSAILLRRGKVRRRQVNSDKCHEVLQQRFGYDDYLPGQRDAIELLMLGKSVLTVFPTGGGKSLCYQLPALMLEDGLTLVVSPLIALMEDQVSSLRRRGIEADALHSALDKDASYEVLERLRSRQTKLLFVAPERMINERFRMIMEGIEINLLAVDEAHCISEWGQSFRPVYLMIADFARALEVKRILALTATATPEVKRDICHDFNIETENVIMTPFYRPNLAFEVTQAPQSEQSRKELLLERVEARDGAVIVYVSLQKTADEIANFLCLEGLPAKSYHAGHDPEKRKGTQRWFMDSDDGIIVATIAFGMGVDKPNIRGVIHYNLPKSLEGYLQEVGRAGRDGHSAKCDVLACLENDVPLLEAWAHCDTPSAVSVEACFQDIFIGSVDSEITLNAYQLSKTHDIKKAALEMLSAYIQIYGKYWVPRTPSYAQAKFKLPCSVPQFSKKVAGIMPEHVERSFLQNMRKKKIWTYLELDDELMGAVTELEAQGILQDVNFTNVSKRYWLEAVPEDISAFAHDCHQRLLKQEERELARINEVIDLLKGKHCLAAQLMRHVDAPDIHEDFACGKCSVCLSGKPLKFKRHYTDVAPADWAAFAANKRFPRDDHRLLARVAFGVSSPRINALKLNREHLFGAFAGCRFTEVLQLCQDLCDSHGGV